MADPGIERREGYVAVDCTRADAREVAELYRALAVEVVQTQVTRVLVKAADSGSEGHYALRDALTTVILAGIPAGFRLALLTNVARLEAMFGELRRDLLRLQIAVALFRDEAEAADWLTGKRTPQAAESQSARPQA